MGNGEPVGEIIETSTTELVAQARAARPDLAYVAIAVPIPSAGPPKYSATSAAMTARHAAIRSPVMR